MQIKANIIDAMQDYLVKKGFSDFRAKSDSTHGPRIVVKTKKGDEITPDMTAKKDGKDYIFEVELGNRLNNTEFIEKCRYFYKEATKREGNLYLVVPAEKFDKTLQVINRNNLENVGILQINISNN